MLREDAAHVFLPELNEGVSAKRAEVIKSMYSAAAAGNVSAQKAFLALTEQAETTPPVPTARPVKEVPLGKKELADIEAQDRAQEF